MGSQRETLRVVTWTTVEVSLRRRSECIVLYEWNVLYTSQAKSYFKLFTQCNTCVIISTVIVPTFNSAVTFSDSYTDIKGIFGPTMYMYVLINGEMSSSLRRKVYRMYYRICRLEQYFYWLLFRTSFIKSFCCAFFPRFTPTQLVERLKGDGWNLKAVIDLTFTSRYYSPKVCLKSRYRSSNEQVAINCIL